MEGEAAATGNETQSKGCHRKVCPEFVRDGPKRKLKTPAGMPALPHKDAKAAIGAT